MTNIVLMYTKFGSSKGHIGAASAVGILVFIMTSVCALSIFYLLRDKDAENERQAARRRQQALKEMGK
jgi:ABC-type sugar transport system permease subunit